MNIIDWLIILIIESNETSLDCFWVSDIKNDTNL